MNNSMIPLDLQCLCFILLAVGILGYNFWRYITGRDVNDYPRRRHHPFSDDDDDDNDDY